MFDQIKNAAGERLDTTFTPAAAGSSAGSTANSAADSGPGSGSGRELVVIGHGVTANKDREWAVTLSKALASVGYPSLRFSFSGNGASEGSFEDSCPSKEVEDLGAVLDATEDWHVTYVGHSMGAAVGVIRAATDPRIKRLISLAGMVDTADFARRKFGKQAPGSSCMWDKPECPLSQQFLDDMNQIASVENLGAQITVPWLLIHGTEDDVVPFQESERIAALPAHEVKFITIPGADHVFSDDATRAMALSVLAWLPDVPTP
jgi:uncharacterized protein